MATNAAIGASGISLALGILNSRGLNSLTEEVETMKKTMASTESPVANEELDAELVQDLQTIDSPSQINAKSIADLVTRIQDLESDSEKISGNAENVTSVKGDLKDLNSKVLALDVDIQETLFSVETVVGLQPDIEDIVRNWNTFTTKAFVTEDLKFHANDCKLGLTKNLGDKSAVHFAGMKDPSWSMYMSNPSGKSPDGKAPLTHGLVSGNALRMRVGKEPTEGLIVENSDRKGVFSVNSQGTTVMGNLVSGDLGDGSCGIAYRGYFNDKSYAICQDKNGATRVSAALNKSVVIGNQNRSKVVVEGADEKSLSIRNNGNTNFTHFNNNGHNIVYCEDGKITTFRVGRNTSNKLKIDKGGVHVSGLMTVDGVNVNNVVKSINSRVDKLEDTLLSRIKAIEAREKNYLDTKKTVHLRNHVANKYLSSNGSVSTSATSIHANYSIHH